MSVLDPTIEHREPPKQSPYDDDILQEKNRNVTTFTEIRVGNSSNTTTKLCDRQTELSSSNITKKRCDRQSEGNSINITAKRRDRQKEATTHN